MGAPGNGSWDGLERRRSTPAERKRWKHEQDVARGVVDVVASPGKVMLTQLAALPKPLLVLVSLVAVILLARLEARWRSAMEAHVDQAEVDRHRLSLLEEKSRVMTDRLDKLTDAVELQVRMTIDFYRWTAERAGDERKMRQYDAKLRELEASP